MGRYLDMLKKSGSAGEPDLQNLQNPPQSSFVGFVGTPPPGFQKNEAANEGGGAICKAETARAWLLHFADRDPLEVWCAPPATHVEAFAGYPDAIEAEPLALIEPQPLATARACKRCRHRARPGHAEPGYCAVRTDTTHAYGPGHPLHRLPADGGADCDQFEDWT